MIGERLKFLRLANSLTQSQVADMLRIHRATYAYYETGRTVPDANTIALLAKMFSVTTDFLISGNSGESSESACFVNDNFSSYDPADYPEYFSSLTADEKKLVMLYRVISEKEDVMNLVREKYEKEIVEGHSEEE